MRLPEQPSLFTREQQAASETDPREQVFTIGHSTRKLEELISALKHYAIERVVDIRHFPTSRHNPQFNKPILEQALREHGIDYVWLERLGGYRQGGYLAYTQTEDFQRGIEELERLAREKRAACMCAEVKWYRCHRRRVSDVLAERGWLVIHIFHETRAEEHFEKHNVIKCD